MRGLVTRPTSGSFVVEPGDPKKLAEFWVYYEHLKEKSIKSQPRPPPYVKIPLQDDSPNKGPKNRFRIPLPDEAVDRLDLLKQEILKRRNYENDIPWASQIVFGRRLSQDPGNKREIQLRNWLYTRLIEIQGQIEGEHPGGTWIRSKRGRQTVFKYNGTHVSRVGPQVIA